VLQFELRILQDSPKRTVTHDGVQAVGHIDYRGILTTFERCAYFAQLCAVFFKYPTGLLRNCFWVKAFEEAHERTGGRGKGVGVQYSTT
jgi:hypothetical protein